MEHNKQLQKTLDRTSYVLSAVILGLVIFMRPAQRLELGMDFSFLPGVNAIVNTFTTIFLLLALYYIKQKKVIAHRNAIFGAMFCSFIFLICYILYHVSTPETSYCHEGNIRYLYYFVLISHILLSGISLPFILLTFSRGISYNVPAHRKLARKVFPVWLYVAISGPMVYLMLRSCY